MLQRHIYGANVWESLSSSAKRFLITNESTALRNRTDTYGAFGAIHWIGVAYTERVGWMSSMKRRVGWRDVYSEQSWEIPLVLLGLLMIRSRFFDWTDELSLRRWNWWGGSYLLAYKGWLARCSHLGLLERYGCLCGFSGCGARVSRSIWLSRAMNDAAMIRCTYISS